jgi:uncharacterized protein YcsI (UPF0317 family)
VQANLVIVTQHLAADFWEFCRINPKPCPLLEVTAAGQFGQLALAPDADLRSDIPKYRVFRHGEIETEPTDLHDIWRDDLVSFLLGCSFTFDAALQRAGVEVRHIREGKNVPMYVTNLACNPVGPFSGPLVVSMRPAKPDQIGLVTQISSSMPLAHGSPVHVGDPAEIGIADLTRPEFGDVVAVGPDEVPVFWACGTTPQVIVRQVKAELMITHAPGHMLVTDLRETDLEKWADRIAIRPNFSVREKR